MKSQITEKKVKEKVQKEAQQKQVLELLEQLVQISVEHFFKNYRE
jgi:uncharacterized membrane protein YheB (UPF0754 family)